MTRIANRIYYFIRTASHYRLSQNVISYYQNYLSLESTVESIKKFTGSDASHATVAIPFIKERPNALE